MSFSKLDRTRIVSEALVLLQEEGLAQVSLRKLAGRLSVGVSSLYWHLADRDALYSEMAERIFRSCLEAIPPSDGWEDWLRGFGRTLWRAQNEVRDARQLIVRAAMAEAVRAELRAEIVARLGALGLAPAAASAAQRSVQALVTGWTTLTPHAPRGDGPEQKSFDAALDVLICGWRTKMGAANAG